MTSRDANRLTQLNLMLSFGGFSCIMIGIVEETKFD